MLGVIQTRRHRNYDAKHILSRSSGLLLLPILEIDARLMTLFSVRFSGELFLDRARHCEKVLYSINVCPAPYRYVPLLRLRFEVEFIIMPLRTGSFEVISTVSSALSLLSCGYIVGEWLVLALELTFVSLEVFSVCNATSSRVAVQ
jgi:hypothetical protein